MDNFLIGLPGVTVFLDDILVSGKTSEEHVQNLCAVLQSLSDSGLKSHYYMDRILVMSCDASAVGIDAVLQQPDDDGVYHPVAYVPRKLTDTERRYPQIEREALAIAFRVPKFRQYLLGRSFILLTDYKPLVTLLGEKNGIPQLVSKRIKCWALLLSAYKYEIKYITSKENVLADYLSRAPLPDLPDAADSAIACEDIMLIDGEGLSQIPLTFKVNAAETVEDPVLSKAFRLTQEGWPETCPDDDLKPYHVRRLELTTDQGCVMWGSTVIIPKQLRCC